MLSSDHASYSWYYTATFWAPAWAEQVYMVLPANGMVVMNLYRQLFTRPAYSVKCDNPLCHAHNQTHTTRGGRAMRWFFKEDWSKRRTSYDYDNTVLLVNFTHHERQLVMVSQDLFLF